MADCAKIGLLNHTGKAIGWYLGPNEASARHDHEIDARFFAANLAMMISPPNEYAVMLDRAQHPSGEDRKAADAMIAKVRYGLIPAGSAYAAWKAKC